MRSLLVSKSLGAMTKGVGTYLVVMGVVLGFSLGQTFADPLVVTPSNNALQLAQALAGPGITITSAALSESNDVTQQGLFSGGSGILPFDSGVALTNGSINNIPGPNNTSGVDTEWGGPGYSPLEALNGNTFTEDANVLTFTFVPTGNQVSFQYAFGSEEYNEYVGAFNDVFGFYLNGTNIALIPGTSSPITINAVNCMSNSQYYTNNDPFTGSDAGCSGDVANPLNTQYDGLVGVSKPLYATGSVTANQPNTITLAVADTGDDILDSGVMIAGDSFTNGPPPTSTPEPGSLILLGTGLAAAALLLLRRQKEESRLRA